MSTIKKLDIIIIVCMLILSITPNIIFAYRHNKHYDSTYATIKIDGKIDREINLSSDNVDNSFTINTQHGFNTISVKNGSISILDADCNDSVCIKQGEISNVGETVVCLPHKLIIEIKGDDKDSSSDMILSH